MIFSKIQVQFRIRIHKLEIRIRIQQKVSDPQHWGLQRISILHANCIRIAEPRVGSSQTLASRVRNTAHCRYASASRVHICQREVANQVKTVIKIMVIF
jgi:hypothetical protein